MKTRSGFVSNSSSSSFILYGAYIGSRLDSVAKNILNMATDEEIQAIFGADVTRDEVDLDELEDILRESEYSDTGIAAFDQSGLTLYNYDDYYLGFGIGVSRESLIKGHGWTEEELNAIDLILADLTGNTGDVHEGEYYC